jgi:hypothetical protein
MASICCVKDCRNQASIRQPLKLGNDLVLHVPLCGRHNLTWEKFTHRMNEAHTRAVKEGRDAAWLLDAALALALFPPETPL